ncbi:MAG: type II toxin-antitoxin system Phd/YefM family antitoxin [Burkholderiaceae bacterium]|jgi:prevent-host-death family protein|nr:type II toxin-antitoxin system Phd/YefM family antitoxin [Burkholderiaceae bacterium]
METAATHSFSSRQFTAHVAQAKRHANSRPVFISDRGTPTHVLMSIEEYKRLTGGGETLRAALAMPAAADDFEFDAPKARIGLRIPSFGDDE